MGRLDVKTESTPIKTCYILFISLGVKLQPSKHIGFGFALTKLHMLPSLMMEVVSSCDLSFEK